MPSFLRNSIPLLLLSAACNGGDNLVVPPSVPSSHGMTVTLFDSVVAPGGGVRAQLENHTGGSIEFGPPGCAPVQQLTSRGWVPTDLGARMCEQIIISLADGQVSQFGFEAPATSGRYRWQVSVWSQRDSEVVVTTEPVAVR